MTKIFLTAMMAAALSAAEPDLEKRASELETKAAKHEQEADRMANDKGYNPLAHKWPAMVQGRIDRERSKAMQARRAARELRETLAKQEGRRAPVEASAESR